MSYTLVVEPSAARDVADAYAYYTEHGRGDGFMAAIDHAFAQIADLPLMYPVAYSEVRRALLRRFAYSVFFIVEAGLAIVLAVWRWQDLPRQGAHRACQAARRVVLTSAPRMLNDLAGAELRLGLVEYPRVQRTPYDFYWDTPRVDIVASDTI